MKKTNNLKSKILATGLAIALGINSCMEDRHHVEVTRKIETKELDLMKSNSYFQEDYNKEEGGNNGIENIFVKKKNLNLGDTIRCYNYMHPCIYPDRYPFVQQDFEGGLLEMMKIKRLSSIDSIDKFFNDYNNNMMKWFFDKNKGKGFATIYGNDNLILRWEKENGKKISSSLKKYSEDYWKIRKQFEKEDNLNEKIIIEK